MPRLRCFPKALLLFRCQLTCFLLPVVLAPIPLVFDGKEALCGYVVLIMAYLWVTETVPLAITSLIPVVAFPLLGVSTAAEVSSAYLCDSNFVFFGSMVMAVAVECSKLHERVALKTLLMAGPNPRWLMLGFIISTSFISMWISNTACTMMMVPIVVAVIKELDLCRRRRELPEQAHKISVSGSESFLNKDSEEILNLDEVPKEQLNVYKSLLLAICFAASIGGTGTLIGTPPNIVLNAYLHKWYGDQNPINFASFILYSLPQMLILIVICWLWLQTVFVRLKPLDRSHEGLVYRMLQKKYDALGQVTYSEKTMISMFLLLVGLWMSRSVWSPFLPNGSNATDGTIAMFIALLLFVLPAQNPFSAEDHRKPSKTQSTVSTVFVEDIFAKINASSSSASDKFTAPTSFEGHDSQTMVLRRRKKQIPTIMTWPLMRDKFSWSTLVLLGGGFAMSAGMERSGLSDYIGSRLSLVDCLPEFVFIAIACFLTTFLTEFSSNIATASIFIPMVASIARSRGTHPLVYVLPVTLASSYAFMLPAGTPPNAIVFAVKILRVTDMMLGGVVLNISAFFVSQILTYTYGHWIFQFDKQLPVNLTRFGW